MRGTYVCDGGASLQRGQCRSCGAVAALLSERLAHSIHNLECARRFTSWLPAGTVATAITAELVDDWLISRLMLAVRKSHEGKSITRCEVLPAPRIGNKYISRQCGNFATATRDGRHVCGTHKQPQLSVQYVGASNVSVSTPQERLVSAIADLAAHDDNLRKMLVARLQLATHQD